MSTPREEADPPGRALPGRQQHDRLERPGVRQPDRLRLLRALRADRRARPVRLPVPGRGPAAARAPRPDPRPGRRRPPGHAHRAERDRRGHHPPRARRHHQHHVQRAVRAGPPVRLPGPPLRRARRLEPGDQLGRVHRGELPARRLPAARAALRPGPGDPGRRPRAVAQRRCGRRRAPRRAVRRRRAGSRSRRRRRATRC